MLNKVLVYAGLLCTLTSTVVAVVEVIPGPGFPSLESLGLTSEELFAKGPLPALTSRITELQKRYDNVCQTWSTGSVDNVIACFNYLEALGTQACGVSGGPESSVIMCTAGDAEVSGVNISNEFSASSYCSNAVLGVQWIFTYRNNGGQVGGSAAANGNGNLVMSVDNVSWG
ncbi:uncharacterized protein FIBRA_05550 [Fibroporia radiculosa]|uniref:Ecp2 effector protein domain-containing protein n=1 Tax=Fibroporia radiculosa TaxID=599839 RepID=J4H3K8_9APHY|nr:uncharacterized protein FIBRA_05550 [Fibroporia radiculosa]CCM03419.1 predicted protein [Fibroporia radiculosa]